MEWSRAKTILLVVLICTNLFLAGNLLWQVCLLYTSPG